MVPEGFVLRPYHPSDLLPIARLCATVYGGTDTFPRMLESAAGPESGAAHPIECSVLEDSTTGAIVALAAYQLLAPSCALLLGVRVADDHRGRGLAHAVTQHATDLAARACATDGPLPARVMACTSAHNHAMRRVLSVAGFAMEEAFALFPPAAWMGGHRGGGAPRGDFFDDLEGRAGDREEWRRLLGCLHTAASPVPLAAWRPCADLGEARRLLARLALQWPSGWIPRFFAAIPSDAIVEADVCCLTIAEGEGWCGLLHCAEDDHLPVRGRLVAGLVASDEAVVASALLWLKAKRRPFRFACHKTLMPPLMRQFHDGFGVAVRRTLTETAPPPDGP